MDSLNNVKIIHITKWIWKIKYLTHFSNTSIKIKTKIIILSSLLYFLFVCVKELFYVFLTFLQKISMTWKFRISASQRVWTCILTVPYIESCMSHPLGHGAVWLKRVKKHIYFEWNNFCCNTVIVINISIDKTFSVHDFQKLFMWQCL